MDKFPRKRSAFRVWIEGRNKELQDFYGKRKINYPELGEQLDCIWHDIDDDGGGEDDDADEDNDRRTQ